MSNAEERDTRMIPQSELSETEDVAFGEVLCLIYSALEEKGYDSIQQIAYYLLTGEPAYITAHRNARALTSQLERDEIIEELVRFYVNNHPAM